MRDIFGYKAATEELELPEHFSVESLGRLIVRYPQSTLMDLVAKRAAGGLSSAELANAPELPKRVNSGFLAYFAWFSVVSDSSLDSLKRATLMFARAFRGNPKLHVPQQVYDTWLRSLYLTDRYVPDRLSPRKNQVHPETWWGVQSDSLNPNLSRYHRPVKEALRRAAEQQTGRILEAIQRLDFTISAVDRERDAGQDARQSAKQRSDLSAHVANEILARERLQERFDPEQTVGFSGLPPSAVVEALSLLGDGSSKRLLEVGFEEQAQWFSLAFNALKVTKIDEGPFEVLQRPRDVVGAYEPWYDVSKLVGPFNVALVSDSLDVYHAVPLLAPLIPNGKIIVVGLVPLNVRRAWESTGTGIKGIQSFSCTTGIRLAVNKRGNR